jgi:hypothetical protein
MSLPQTQTEIFRFGILMVLWELLGTNTSLEIAGGLNGKIS